MWIGVMQVHYVVCACVARFMHHVGVISDIFSFFCYMVMGRKNLSYLFYHNTKVILTHTRKGKLNIP